MLGQLSEERNLMSLEQHQHKHNLPVHDFLDTYSGDITYRNTENGSNYVLHHPM